MDFVQTKVSYFKSILLVGIRKNILEQMFQQFTVRTKVTQMNEVKIKNKNIFGNKTC